MTEDNIRSKQAYFSFSNSFSNDSIDYNDIVLSCHDGVWVHAHILVYLLVIFGKHNFTQLFFGFDVFLERDNGNCWGVSVKKTQLNFGDKFKLF